jgi:hypothetical protein
MLSGELDRPIPFLRRMSREDGTARPTALNGRRDERHARKGNGNKLSRPMKRKHTEEVRVEVARYSHRQGTARCDLVRTFIP